MSRNSTLVIAPHPDDESLGAGGFISRLTKSGEKVSVLTVAGHLPPIYQDEDYEKTKLEASKAYGILGIDNSYFLDIPATYVNEVPISNLNKKITEILELTKPSRVLIPFPDRHLDHRLVFESAMVVCRPSSPVGKNILEVLAYETLSETHWNAPQIEPNFYPNYFVDISADIESKVRAISAYESQIPPAPGPRSVDAVRALATFRGSQVGVAAAEAYQLIRKFRA